MWEKMKIKLSKSEVVKLFVYLKTFSNITLVEIHKEGSLKLYRKIRKQYQKQNDNNSKN
jgi:hypothetical protein